MHGTLMSRTVGGAGGKHVVTQTQLNSAATNSRAMSLVAAYERDLVTGAPDSKLIQGTESLSFGAVTLSFGSIRRSRRPVTESPAVRFSPHGWPRHGLFMAGRLPHQPFFQARQSVRYFVDFLDFSIGLGTDT
jgi:hypothetical protein